MSKKLANKIERVAVTVLSTTVAATVTYVIGYGGVIIETTDQVLKGAKEVANIIKEA